MPEFLNFDAITAEIITFQSRGQRYDLRDDVPFEVLIQALPLLNRFANLGEAFADVDLTDADGIDELLAPLRAQSIQLCGAIFRHSLPDITDDEIERHFSLMQRVQIIKLFFTRIGSESRTLQSATAPEESKPAKAKRSGGATR